MNYNNIHIHSHYSTLDGIPTPAEYVQKAIEFGQDAVAITDHGSIAGWYSLWKATKDTPVKGVAACEFYVVDNMHVKEKGEFKGHLCLYARTLKGQENIRTLHNLAQMEGFYSKPRVDWALLRKYSDGIIATTACLGGHVAAAYLREKLDKNPKTYIEMLQRIYGKNLLLEIQPGNTERQMKVNEYLFKYSAKYGVPLIATTDAHYLTADDYDLHDTYICINTKQNVSTKDRFKFETNNNYFMSAEQMLKEFAKMTKKEYKDQVVKAIENTKKLTDRCEPIHFESLSVYDALPSFYGDTDTENRTFQQMCADGLKRIGKWEDKTYRTRAQEEYKVISEFGFINYFLVMKDVIDNAKRNGVLVGHGRGSAAGSLCCYLLGITHVDPLEYDLLFERFLSPDRKGELPDIDVDFEDRDWAIEYAKKKWGDKNVMSICTFTKMGLKNTIKDVGRAHGMDFPLTNWITSQMDELGVEDVDGVKREGLLSRNPVVLDFVEKLSGRNRNVGTHASGVIISSKPISDLLPVIRVGGKDGKDLIALEMNDVAELGFTKFDFLGLSTLKVLNGVLKQTGQSLDDIPLNDKDIYDQFLTKNMAGIFQFEAQFARRLINDIAPESIDDIAVASALNRPGPLNSGMHKLYIENKRNPSRIKYLHPLLEGILGKTYGVLVYQEQVMQIAKVLAGFSAKDSNKLRKAVSKKKADVMESIKQQFVDGCQQNSVSVAVANTLWDQIEKFAEYGFNKSHSVSYSILTYQTMWAKYHHPDIFYAELLNSKKISEHSGIIREAKRNGISVKVCNINRSGNQWSAREGCIYEGFSALKGFGEVDGTVLESIRGTEEFDSFDAFYQRAKGRIKPGKIKILIENHAFIGCDDRRKEELLELLEKLKKGK